jgi:hypothetical protein
MKPLRLIQYAWVIEVALLILVGVSLIYLWPDRVSAFVSMLPLLSTMIIAQGGAAFGGPAISRAQQNKANGGSLQGVPG